MYGCLRENIFQILQKEEQLARVSYYDNVNTHYGVDPTYAPLLLRTLKIHCVNFPLKYRRKE
jgi:hypothetical protein